MVAQARTARAAAARFPDKAPMRGEICLRCRDAIKCGSIMIRRLLLRGWPLPILWLFLPLGTTILALSGCGRQQNSTQLNYQMGERITNGPLVYNVVQTIWRTQLG